MARIFAKFACIALRLTIATAVQDGTAVAPNPFDAPTNKRRERKHTHAESATCYGRRYPDLAYAFCKDECNVRALHDHFRDHGRREGRRFGCEAAPLTAAETAKWPCMRPRLIVFVVELLRENSPTHAAAATPSTRRHTQGTHEVRPAAGRP